MRKIILVLAVAFVCTTASAHDWFGVSSVEAIWLADKEEGPLRDVPLYVVGRAERFLPDSNTLILTGSIGDVKLHCRLLTTAEVQKLARSKVDKGDMVIIDGIVFYDEETSAYVMNRAIIRGRFTYVQLD